MIGLLDPADPDGATPLGPDDVDGLIPSDIATRGDLNRAELENIVEARTWAMARSWTPTRVLDVKTLRNLHRRMFGDVWRWAGKPRQRETTIGVDPRDIAIHLRNLLDDVTAWLDHQTYPPDEVVLRFHHRLVAIHPFANGNGRHARLCADLLARALALPAYTWGAGSGTAAQIRSEYLSALRAMDLDRDDVGPLMRFARAARVRPDRA